MVKIVILGSCRHAPYEILAVPNPLPGCGNDEAGYREACKKFYPAIDEADLVLVYAPDGKIGEHTARDIMYAESRGKYLNFDTHVISDFPIMAWDSYKKHQAKIQKSKRGRRVPSPQSTESPQTQTKEDGDTP